MTEDLTLERFKNVTIMVRYHNDKMIEAFNRFVTQTIAILGGTIWLITQKKDDEVLIEAIITLSPKIILLLGCFALCLIWSNWWSWCGYRKAEAKILDDDSLIPKKIYSKKEQCLMSASIIFFVLLLLVLDPLQLFLNQT